MLLRVLPFFKVLTFEMLAQKPPISWFAPTVLVAVMIAVVLQFTAPHRLTSFSESGTGPQPPVPSQQALANCGCVAQKPCVRVAPVLVSSKLQMKFVPAITVKSELVGPVSGVTLSKFVPATAHLSPTRLQLAGMPVSPTVKPPADTSVVLEPVPGEPDVVMLGVATMIGVPFGSRVTVNVNVPLPP